ncbi:MAG: hypothetical protein Q9227_006232 [Pyrenula ochraceoflavens]
MARNPSQKDELLSIDPNLTVRATSTKRRPERLLLNLTDEEPEQSPERSPLPSPLRLYADWTRTIEDEATHEGAAPPASAEGPRDMRPSLKGECDYDSLPPALRRKYFSSLERLRLAQTAAKPEPHQKHGALTGTYSVSISAGRPAPGKERRPSYLGGRTYSKRLQKQESRKSSYLASQSDAEWFQSLPKKIQRRHFTREEQILLANKRDTVMLDAADEKLYKLGQKANRSICSMHSMASSRGTQSPKVLAETAEEPTEVAKEPAEAHDTLRDEFRWLEDEEDLDLRLDDYHAHIAQVAEPPRTATSLPKRRPSFRRFSLTGGPFGRNGAFSQKASPGSWSRTNSISAPSPTHNRSQSITKATIAAIRRPSQPATSTIDPSAKHYQDPEARLKLRVYLASPQKFDEAVEFGFPSLKKEPQATVRPIGPPLVNITDSNGNARQSFLDDDDNNSITNDEPPYADNEVASLPDSPSPKTPDDVPKRAPSPLTKLPQTSIDSVTSGIQPRIVASRTEPYAKASAGNREMTLHMTLTRPDLRTAEEKNRSPNLDAIKLADLPPAGDTTNIWTTLPGDDGKVKKMWRRLSRW